MDDESAADKTVVAKPGQLVRCKTGQKLIVIIPTPGCIVDSHMHIMNGACTPLPLLWSKRAIVDGWKRAAINFVADVAGKKIGIGEGGKLQVKSTVDIAKRAIEENAAAFAPDTMIMSSTLYQNTGFISVMIAMPMDMEYAHIAGYDGQTIYHTETSPWYYHKRISGAESESGGMRVELPGETTKSFTQWKVQYKDTVTSAKNHPLKLIPMYHYEPRRWRNKSGSEAEPIKWTFGPWDQPFDEIATSERKGLFIGFKMYTPLGYQPLDPVLTHLWQHSGNKSECFYGKCEEEQIPILNHCAPKGMATHEILYYREYHREHAVKFGGTHQDFAYENEPAAVGTPGYKQSDGALSSYSADYEIEYFDRYHVHPKAWRKVLEKFPNLKLCLAHFGGDEWEHGLQNDWVHETISLMKTYPNVYADFSCLNIDKAAEAFRLMLREAGNSQIFKRLLFGTDWYMTMVAMNGKGYKQFCEEYWELIDDVDLWVRFTFINPFEFYGFDDEGKVANLNSALESEITKDIDDKKRNDKQEIRVGNFEALSRLRKEYLRKKDLLGVK